MVGLGVLTFQNRAVVRMVGLGVLTFQSRAVVRMVGPGGGVWRSSRSSVSGGPSPCHVPALPWTGEACGSGPLSVYSWSCSRNNRLQIPKKLSLSIPENMFAGRRVSFLHSFEPYLHRSESYQGILLRHARPT